MDQEIAQENTSDPDQERQEEITGQKAGESLDTEAILRQQLEELQAQSAEYLDGWQRARAEMINARKRWEREAAQAYTNTVVDVISRLLPVVDDFERAVASAPAPAGDESWANGVLMIFRKLLAFLEQHGVTPIKVEPGAAFDPSEHEAVTHEPHEALAAGAVIAEFQRGYRLGDRVVRPAMVRVSAGSPAAESGNVRQGG
ncbi:MAG: nucleotide exchange factor GrpE [Chloroflexota bacterium]